MAHPNKLLAITVDPMTARHNGHSLKTVAIMADVMVPAILQPITALAASSAAG